MEVFHRTQRLKTCVFSIRFLRTSFRHYCIVNPKEKKENVCTAAPGIEQETINRIEKLSLLDFKGDYSVSVLKAAIDFTECLRTAKISDTVKPMYSPLENEFIPLRNDKVEHNICKRKILKNAAVLEEDYFVAPFKSNKET